MLVDLIQAAKPDTADTAQVPLWALLATAVVGFIAVVIGPWVSTRATNKHQEQEFERQVQEEHRQWLRQKRVETYELILSHFLNYEEWRRSRDTMNVLNPRNLKQLYPIFHDSNVLQSRCRLYIPSDILFLLGEANEAYNALCDSDLRRVLTFRPLANNALPDNYVKSFDRLEYAIRQDIQRLRREEIGQSHPV